MLFKNCLCADGNNLLENYWWYKKEGLIIESSSWVGAGEMGWTAHVEGFAPFSEQGYNDVIWPHTPL